MGQANFSAGTPTKCFYNKDDLGSIRELTDSTGAIKTRYSYDPYSLATETFVSGTTSADFQYAEYYLHGRSGLNMPVYRSYNAGIGRFINRDPIEERGGVNLYGYVQNNPLSGSDSLGLVLMRGWWTPRWPWNKPPVEPKEPYRDCKDRCDTTRDADYKICDQINDPCDREKCYGAANARHESCIRDCGTPPPPPQGPTGPPPPAGDGATGGPPPPPPNQSKPPDHIGTE